MKVINNIKNVPRQITSNTVVQACNGKFYLVVKDKDYYILFGLTENFMRPCTSLRKLPDLISENNLVFVTDDFDIVLNNPVN